MRRLILPLTACFTLIAQGAIAQPLEFPTVKCYFFEGEKLSIENTCTQKVARWTGGGVVTLTWEDGVKTVRSFGVRGRGEKACPNDGEENIDEVCGKTYDRHPQTFKRLSGKAAEQVQQSGKGIRCVQLKNKSVCWKFPI
jgi:hypothetical protein